MSGLSNRDPILADIKRAARDGHFDDRDAHGPSELELTSVEDLLEWVSSMSPERRKLELARIGRVRRARVRLSGKPVSRTRRTRQLLTGRSGGRVA